MRDVIVRSPPLINSRPRSFMTTDLKQKLKELLIERLKFEDMTPDDIGDDDPLFAGGLGLDSIDALEIVVMLETEFGVKVKNESSARDYFRSISTLADFVEARLAQQANA
jgi:acyl carrier protein